MLFDVEFRVHPVLFSHTQQWFDRVVPCTLNAVKGHKTNTYIIKTFITESSDIAGHVGHVVAE